MKSSRKQPDNSKFPKLMISTLSDSVYLMTSEREGTKVFKGSHCSYIDDPIGTHYKNWTPKHLIGFNESITLSN